MISRANTVNLSNMPVLSEKIYGAETTETKDEALTTLFSALNIHTRDHMGDEWKITKFMTTPLVGLVLVTAKWEPSLVVRCQHTSLPMQMVHLHTWKVHIRAL